MKLRNSQKLILEIVQMIAGNAICAFSMACFALPYNMVVSGVSGIGRILKESMGISVPVSVAVINIAFFLMGAFILGRKFAASTAIGTFAYPFFLGVFQNIEMLQHLVDDPLLAAICAGVLDGVGLGLVIRIGGSTGGIDIPAIILNKKFSWKTGTVMSAFDSHIPDTDPGHKSQWYHPRYPVRSYLQRRYEPHDPYGAGRYPADDMDRQAA